jgi:hypothetical protein
MNGIISENVLLLQILILDFVKYFKKTLVRSRFLKSEIQCKCRLIITIYDLKNTRFREVYILDTSTVAEFNLASCTCAT